MRRHVTRHGEPGDGKGEPSVAVIILNWNQAGETAACMASALNTEYSNWCGFVVDNGSNRESLMELRASLLGDDDHERSPSLSTVFRLLESPTNRGFAGGCNFAVTEVIQHGFEYVLLLNNDAHIGPSTLKELVDVARESNAGVVGGVLIDHGGTAVTYTGGTWPERLFVAPRPKRIHNSRWWVVGDVSGALMLISRDLMHERLSDDGFIFNPGFFMYGEDVDLCLYASTRSYLCVMAGHARAHHRGGFSSGGAGSCRAYYYLTRNRVFLADRWLKTRTRWLFHLYFAPTRVALISARWVAGKRVCGRATLSGLVDAYRRIDGQWAKHDLPR